MAPAVLLFTGNVAADSVDEYVVKAGDTLSQIAETELGSVAYVDEIARVNHITNKNVIHVGQKLNLKDIAKQTVPQTTAQVQAVTQAVEQEASPMDAAAVATDTVGNVVLPNGNTAGSVGLAAAQEIARRTGTDASIWENIIARESNGQVDAYNPSGASGLFQTMPGWGSTATVEDQINSAINAYNAQGFGAWGY